MTLRRFRPCSYAWPIQTLRPRASALAAAVCGPSPDRSAATVHASLRAITGIDVVESIQRSHRVGSTNVTTKADHLVEPGRVVVVNTRTQVELRRAVARAIATIIEPTTDGPRLLADALYFLMGCRNAADLQHELQQRGVPWSASQEAPRAVEPSVEPEEDEDPDTAAIADAMRHSVVEGIQTSEPSPPPPLQVGNSSSRPHIDVRPLPISRALPELESVRVILTSTRDAPPQNRWWDWWCARVLDAQNASPSRGRPPTRASGRRTGPPVGAQQGRSTRSRPRPGDLDSQRRARRQPRHPFD